MEKKIFLPEFRSALLILLNLDVVVSQVSAFKKGVKRRGVIVDAYLGCGQIPWSLQLSYFK